MPRAAALKREAEVSLQVWAWWFLTFDLPLRSLGTPHVAPCTMGRLMSTHSPPPMPFTLAPLALVSPIHGPRHNGVVDRRDDVKKLPKTWYVLACVCFCLALNRIFCR